MQLLVRPFPSGILELSTPRFYPVLFATVSFLIEPHLQHSIGPVEIYRHTLTDCQILSMTTFLLIKVIAVEKLHTLSRRCSSDFFSSFALSSSISFSRYFCICMFSWSFLSNSNSRSCSFSEICSRICVAPTSL